MELLVQGDCVEKMQHVKDGRIDLVITSPPYDNLRKYNDSSSWNFDKFKDVANELYRIVKDGGIVVWIVSDKTVKGSETLSSFKQALYFKEIGFNMFDTMIWRKPNPSVPTQDRYYNAFEYMFILTYNFEFNRR